ncbi:MAG TPA: type I-U CRISPR-associated protein Csb2 [Bacillota bacterium]|nr:type I-U CRISPR-associated protein Csb2 [Bacillota bacterium]
MLALGIRYLNGFAAASQPGHQSEPEWPPHPARVFMALAAAHFETGADPCEREALLWLGALPAPTLRAPDATLRSVITHYVPVNDKTGDKTNPPTAIIQSFPGLARERQPRTFGRVWLEDEHVYLAWTNATGDERALSALGALCRKVTRIGHSMSMVQMWVASAEEAGEPNWVPDGDRAEIHLRVPGPGTLADLERRYNGLEVQAYTSALLAAEEAVDAKSRTEARRRLREDFGASPPQRLRPQIPFYQGYARPVNGEQRFRVAGTAFSPHLITFTLEPYDAPYRELDLLCVTALTQHWREALVSQSSDMLERVREIVSGRSRDGCLFAGPHLAFVPLAFAGQPYADGHLLGIAVALPLALGLEERRQVLRVLGRVNELRLGRLGVWRLERDTSERPAVNLRTETWTSYPDGATHWSTVTPIVFDRHPKSTDRGEYQRQVAEMFATGCAAIGLPRPSEVIVTPVSAHRGVPPAYAFPRVQRKDGSERRHAHTILVFDQPVHGPILIGAGRYRGYGVARPLGVVAAPSNPT